MKGDNKDNNIEKFMTDYLKEEAENRERKNKDDLIVNFDISYPDGTDESFICGEESEVFGLGEGYIKNKIEPEELKCFYGDSNIDMTSEYDNKSEKCEVKDKDKDIDDCHKGNIKINFAESDSKEEDYECDGKWSNCEEEIKEKVCNESSNEEYDDDYYMSDYFNEDHEEECRAYKDEKNHEQDYKNEEECEEYKDNDKEDYSIYKEDYNGYCEEKREKVHEKKHDKKPGGKIVVISTLNSIDCTRIKGVKINLYKLNGICPELVCSEVTDCEGKVVFTNVSDGDYRVIEIIDKNYFNKPAYVNWNEVRIDGCSRECTIYVVNTINRNCIKKCR